MLFDDIFAQAEAAVRRGAEQSRQQDLSAFMDAFEDGDFDTQCDILNRTLEDETLAEYIDVFLAEEVAKDPPPQELVDRAVKMVQSLIRQYNEER